MSNFISNSSNTSLIMSRDKIIEETNMEFHNIKFPSLKEGEYNLNLFPENPDYKFGILKIKIADTPIITSEQSIDASIDISGSMDSTCDDGQSKMHHANHSIKNIINVIGNSENASVEMSVCGFDNDIKTIFTDKNVTMDSINELRQQINNLIPRNSTDIYKSVEMQKERSNERSNKNPNTRQFNITMTDGQTNCGKSLDYLQISSQVPENSTNVYIGYGKDHNAIGLQLLADIKPNGMYLYIPELEKSGLILGELMHLILYTALTNITIEIFDGEIHNFKNNTWSNKLEISSLVGESTKTFHIRTLNPDIIEASITAQSMIHNETEPSLIENNIFPIPALIEDDVSNPIEIRPECDLSIEILRLQTQILMFKAHEYSLTACVMKDDILMKSIKKELKDYIKFLNQYAEENNQKDNEMLILFISDITIILKTFGSERAAMYSGVRSESQGRQTSNTIYHIDEEDIYRNSRHRRNNGGRFQRQNACDILNNSDEDYEDDEDDEDHNIPQPAKLTREYTTPRQMTMMRGVSEGGTYLRELN